MSASVTFRCLLLTWSSTRRGGSATFGRHVKRQVRSRHGAAVPRSRLRQFRNPRAPAGVDCANAGARLPLEPPVSGAGADCRSLVLHLAPSLRRAGHGCLLDAPRRTRPSSQPRGALHSRFEPPRRALRRARPTSYSLARPRGGAFESARLGGSTRRSALLALAHGILWLSRECEDAWSSSPTPSASARGRRPANPSVPTSAAPGFFAPTSPGVLDRSAASAPQPRSPVPADLDRLVPPLSALDLFEIRPGTAAPAPPPCSSAGSSPPRLPGGVHFLPNDVHRSLSATSARLGAPEIALLPIATAAWFPASRRSSPSGAACARAVRRESRNRAIRSGGRARAPRAPRSRGASRHERGRLRRHRHRMRSDPGARAIGKGARRSLLDVLSLCATREIHSVVTSFFGLPTDRRELTATIGS